MNLSPSPDRVGRACVFILEDEEFSTARALMVACDGGRLTFPGGGVMPFERFEDAARREAWEEAGAHVRVLGLLFYEPEPHLQSHCYLGVLERLESSPEGRKVQWVNPRQAPWCFDRQIAPALRALGLEPIVSTITP